MLFLLLKLSACFVLFCFDLFIFIFILPFVRNIYIQMGWSAKSREKIKILWKTDDMKQNVWVMFPFFLFYFCSHRFRFRGACSIRTLELSPTIILFFGMPQFISPFCLHVCVFVFLLFYFLRTQLRLLFIFIFIYLLLVTTCLCLFYLFIYLFVLFWKELMSSFNI